jgi:cyclic di-GMP phosphodiesterase
MDGDNFNVLIVDDIGKNIQVVANLLKDEGYRLSYAMSGEQALKVLQENDYDLVLLDIMMPGLDGYQTCIKIKKLVNYSEVPVIFLTARDDHDSIVQGFESGGQDYVTKPFNTAELLARVRTHLKLRAFENSQQQKIDKALKDLRALNEELEDSQKEVVFTMGAIAETRSKETGMHVKRVAEYSKLLALLSNIPVHEAEIIALASPMHDLGKVGIPDDILNKAGPLTQKERVIMDNHVILGYDMLKRSKRQIMQTAAIIALEHHEKWDGSGYPFNKKGTEIHLFGRITALADVFDALCSKRCYKEPWNDPQIFEFLRAESGKHFDPTLIDIFFDNIEQFLIIRQTFPDNALESWKAAN